MKYRVTLESEQVSRRPDARSSLPAFFTKKFWQTDTVVEGDSAVVVATLRALIEKIEEEK